MTDTPGTSPPVTPRPAATVILLRDTDSGLSVFLQKRAATMEFAAGMTVFPGGAVEPRDHEVGIDWVGPQPSWWADRMGVDEELAVGLVCAAVRETFEECGVLLAGRRGDGGASGAGEGVVGHAAGYQSVRAELANGAVSLGDFLRSEQLVLRADLLRPWANWVTPAAGNRRRYDTYFFVAALPEGQQADGLTTEATETGWALPAAAIEDFSAGRSFLMPPTWTQLDSLAGAGNRVADVLATQRQIVAVQPEVIGSQGNWSVDFFDVERYKQALRRRPKS